MIFNAVSYVYPYTVLNMVRLIGYCHLYLRLTQKEEYSISVETMIVSLCDIENILEIEENYTSVVVTFLCVLNDNYS
jgi:hypothetical protein